MTFHGKANFMTEYTLRQGENEAEREEEGTLWPPGRHDCSSHDRIRASASAES